MYKRSVQQDQVQSLFDERFQMMPTTEFALDLIQRFERWE